MHRPELTIENVKKNQRVKAKRKDWFKKNEALALWSRAFATVEERTNGT
jgi:acid stress-induced BolA-like protein IbaG/YrbA